MQRERKFRAWTGKEMLYDVLYVNDKAVITDMQGFPPSANVAYRHDIKAIMDFVGLQDKNNKDVYEGDMFRVTKDEPWLNVTEKEDFCIVTWIQEWTMFASLLYDEWINYNNYGVKELDESFLWSYPLNKINERKVIGNIYENKSKLRCHPEFNFAKELGIDS